MQLQTRTTSGRPVDPVPDRKRNVPVTFGEKRPCGEPGCITRLNRYHEGERCYAHEGGQRFRMLDSAEELRELMAEAKS